MTIPSVIPLIHPRAGFESILLKEQHKSQRPHRKKAHRRPTPPEPDVQLNYGNKVIATRSAQPATGGDQENQSVPRHNQPGATMVRTVSSLASYA